MVTKAMGLLLFLIGFLLLIIAMLALLGLAQPSGLFERILMFGGGLILCLAGYWMARDQAPAA